MNRRKLPPLRLTVLAAAVAAAALSGALLRAEDSRADQTLITAEGVTINVYSDGVSAQQVYETLLANGLQAHVKLTQVDVVDAGMTMASVGGGCYPEDYAVQGCWVYNAKIQLRDDLFLARPNYAVGHEYGHVWENYNRWTFWQGKFGAYLEARGLLGDDRLGSSKCWQPYEIIAEDYRQLFGAGEALELSQCNKDIPAAKDVPGLRDFLALTWTNGNPPPNYGGLTATPAPAPTPSPSPAPTPAPAPTAEPTPAPTPEPAPTPAATPSPTPSPAPSGAMSVTVDVGKGWQTFVAPVSGSTDIAVYLSKGGRFPTYWVQLGSTYWLKGPATVTITPE